MEEGNLRENTDVQLWTWFHSRRICHKEIKRDSPYQSQLYAFSCFGTILKQNGQMDTDHRIDHAMYMHHPVTPKSITVGIVIVWLFVLEKYSYKNM